MAAQPNPTTMSVEEYLAFERSAEARYEYIDGDVYLMAGGDSNHSLTKANLVRELGVALRGTRCRVYDSDMKLRLSESKYAYPNASVSCDDRDRGIVEALQYPRLIVEVLSPGTRKYDRGKKSGYYRACPTIEEYVLVDTEQMLVEVYRRGQNHFWTYHPFGPHEQVEFASIGVHFSIEALYENVTFADS